MGRPLKLDSIHQGVRDAAILLRTRYNDLVIPPKSVTYSIWETARLIGCCERKIRTLIQKNSLPSHLDTGGERRIEHTGITRFLFNGASGIKRDIEEVLFEGLIDTPPLARELGLKVLDLSYLLRTGRLPSFNISEGKLPCYRLPLLETLNVFEDRLLESYIEILDEAYPLRK